ncbi:MAG: folate-binding protein [Pseudomonadota bacterium]
MPTVLLPDRSIITVAGEDATHLLHNVLTCNVEELGYGAAAPCALLTPQGKIMFDFLLLKAPAGGYFIDIRTDQADAFLKRMLMYKMRSTVDFAISDQHFSATSFEPDSEGSHFDSAENWHDDRFWDGKVYRHVLPAEKAEPLNQDGITDWHLKRIEYGVAESGTDYELGDAFPHDVSFDSNGGVDFAKGCYVGQEVVSRMYHRGTARRRVMLLAGGAPLPEAGNDVIADGKTVGKLGTVVGNTALMIGRLDRVKDALDTGLKLKAAGTPIESVTLPANVAYDWPESTGDANA